MSDQVNASQSQPYTDGSLPVLKDTPAPSAALDWLPISEATAEDKKGAILGWCDHEADPYHEDAEAHRLTLYAAHTDGLSHVENGPNVLVWGGSFHDHEDDGGAWLPDWWFLKGSEFEVAANPTFFVRLNEPNQ